MIVAPGRGRSKDGPWILLPDAAESICAAQDPGGWCSVRIVAVNAADSTTELSPKSGFDFAFDSVSLRCDTAEIQRRLWAICIRGVRRSVGQR